MPTPFGGEIGSFFDDAQQRRAVRAFGTFEYRASAPLEDYKEQWLKGEVLKALREVIGRKMESGQLTFKDLETGRWSRVIPEVMTSLTVLQQHGIQVGGNLDVTISILPLPSQQQPPQPTQQPPIQMHQAPVHQAPVHQAPVQQAPMQPQQPQHVVEARFRVGGLNINASSDKGLDTAGLENQIKDKAKSNIIWWGVGCGVLFVVLLGVAGLGVYIWYTARTAMSGASATSSKTASAATWDGKKPFTCSGNDSFSFSGVKANLSSTAIKADGNCSLTLVGCDITAPTAIEALGNANVTITGGSLNGSSYAVKADSLAKVKMTGTKVTGKTEASGLAKITGP